jgi:hypothetical protein
MRSRSLAILAFGTLMLAPASAGRAAQKQAPKPAARADAAVPFKPGETLTYDVSWSSLLVAGTAVATVYDRRPAADSTAHYMVAEGRPLPLLSRLYPLHYKMDTLVDTYTLLSHRGTFYAEEGSERRTNTTQFDRGRNRVSFDSKPNGPTAEYAVPPNAEDGLAAFYIMRARGVQAGERFTVPVADSGTLFTAQFEVAGVEDVRVPFGTLPAWHIRLALTDAQGKLFWKNTVVWMSNDARRLPLKLQAELPIGHFVLALKTAS